MLKLRNIVLSSMFQSFHELSISDLVNIVGKRNAVRRLECYDYKFIKKSK
jgi:hypothetical protein